MQIVVERSVRLGDLIEGGFEHLRPGGHDCVYGARVGRFCEAKNLLQVRSCFRNAVGRKRVLRRQNVILNPGLSGHTERRQKNRAKYARSVLTAAAMLDRSKYLIKKRMQTSASAWQYFELQV